MLIGMGTPNVVLPLSAAACREVDLLGVFRSVYYFHSFPRHLPSSRSSNHAPMTITTLGAFPSFLICNALYSDIPFPLPRYASTYQSALALLESGKLDGIERMITHRFQLSESRRAFDLMKAGTDERGGLVVKVCIVGEDE
jgi:L-iditol 2-dehydrogenase